MKELYKEKHNVVGVVVNIHHLYVMFMHGILQKMALTINELNFNNTTAVVTYCLYKYISSSVLHNIFGRCAVILQNVLKSL